VPWPERVLAARLLDGTELVNVRSPTSPKSDLVKVRTHETVFSHLAVRAPARLRLLCGDLNTPRKEHPDGAIWTFARDRYRRLRPGAWRALGPRRACPDQPPFRLGFRDAFRVMHGYSRRELGWERQRYGGGYRLDHLFLSGSWQVLRCEYLHAFRKSGLSDHSALIAELEPFERA
jgi:exodeoxyribonuclease III